jgi:hypothetical protein
MYATTMSKAFASQHISESTQKVTTLDSHFLEFLNLLIVERNGKI